MKLLLNAPAAGQRAHLLTMVFLMLTSGLDAQAPDPRSGRDVHLRIETDRPTYRVGNSISVRLTLRNVSSHPVKFVDDSPAGLARLQVYDAAGQKVEPIFSRSQRSRSGRPVMLEAGKELILHWQNREWLNLRDWGYDLRAPGRYTIVGIPGVVGPKLTPDYETVRSNKATFTIDP
jgi:uncharacterized protein (DUF58 family)